MLRYRAQRVDAVVDTYRVGGDGPITVVLHVVCPPIVVELVLLRLQTGQFVFDALRLASHYRVEVLAPAIHQLRGGRGSLRDDAPVAGGKPSETVHPVACRQLHVGRGLQGVRADIRQGRVALDLADRQYYAAVVAQLIPRPHLHHQFIAAHLRVRDGRQLPDDDGDHGHQNHRSPGPLAPQPSAEAAPGAVLLFLVLFLVLFHCVG